jgi:hypothetical protein
MLTRTTIVAVVLPLGFVLGLGTQAFTQDKKPTEKRPPTTRTGLYRIHAAARSLEDAARHLQRAEQPFGGHRAKALELVKQAEDELKQAVEYAKANPPAATPTPSPGTTPPAKQ